MKIIDLNVLVYAVNADAEQHIEARRWWEKAVDGDETIGLPWVVLLGFLRIATNPRIFENPMSAPEALAKIDFWLERPTVKTVAEKPDHWMILRSLLGASGTAGNLTTDAHLAAIAISHDSVLVSFDNDFGRFEGLRWEHPLKTPRGRPRGG